MQPVICLVGGHPQKRRLENIVVHSIHIRIGMMQYIVLDFPEAAFSTQEIHAVPEKVIDLAVI